MNYLLSAEGLQVISGESNAEYLISDRAFLELSQSAESRIEFLKAVGSTSLVLGRIGVPSGDSFIRCDDEFALASNPS